MAITIKSGVEKQVNGRSRVYAESLRGRVQAASHDDKRATLRL